MPCFSSPGNCGKRFLRRVVRAFPVVTTKGLSIRSRKLWIKNPVSVGTQGGHGRRFKKLGERRWDGERFVAIFIDGKSTPVIRWWSP